MEGEAVLTPRAPDGSAVLSEDTTEEAVVPPKSSESLPIVVGPNQDTAPKILSEEIPEDCDEEVVRVREENPLRTKQQLTWRAHALEARPRRGYPVATPPAPPTASRPPRRRRRWSRTSPPW